MHITRRELLGAVAALGAGDAIPIRKDQFRVVAPNPRALIDLATPFASGSMIRTSDGFTYEVAPAHSSDYHLVTRGGVKLRVLSTGILDFDAFAPDKNGKTDCSEALNVALANFKTVLLRQGNYQAKNILVRTATLSFEDGASLLFVLDEQDVGINCGSDSVLENPRIVHSNTARPPHGGIGCAILIGNYTNIDEYVTRVKINNPKIECINTLPISLGISILGNVHDVEVNNAILTGAFAVGIQAHWGGELKDPSQPQFSPVERSRHPNNIRINGLRALPRNNGAETYIGSNVVSYAAVFDIHARDIVCHGWQRTFLITPGDVYNLVADSDQKHKICTNMSIDGVTLVDPPNSSSSATAFSQMLVNGLSQTDRTRYGRKGAVDGNFDLTVRNVSIKCSRETPFFGAPLVNLYYCAGVNFHVAEIAGFETSKVPLLKLSNTYGCELAVDNATQNLAPFITVNAAIRCSVNANVNGSTTSVANPAAKVLYIGGVGGISTTVAAPLMVGNESVRLHSAGAAYTLTRYSRVHIGSGYVTVSRTTIIPENGAIDVPVIASSLSAPSGTQAAIKAQSIESVFSIKSDLIYLPIFYNRTVSCRFRDCRTVRTGKYDIQEGIVDVFDTHILNCTFDRGGQVDDGTLLANIVLGSSTGGGSEGTEIDHCLFEISGGSFVKYNIAVLSGDVSNLNVHDNYFNDNKSHVFLKTTQSITSLRKGPNRYYDNRIAHGLQSRAVFDRYESMRDSPLG